MSAQARRSSRAVKSMERFEVENPVSRGPTDQTVMGWAMQTVLHEYMQAHTKGKHAAHNLQKSSKLDASMKLLFLEVTQRIRSQVYNAGCKPTPKKAREDVPLAASSTRVSLLSLSSDLLQRLWPPERVIAGSLSCSVLCKALSSSSTVFQSKRHLLVGHISTNLVKRLCHGNGDAILKINLDPGSDDVIAEASRVLSEASERGFKQLAHLELNMRRQPREKRKEASWGYKREKEEARLRKHAKDTSGSFEMSMNRLALLLSSFGSLTHLSLGGLMLGESATYVLLMHCRSLAGLSHLDLRANRRVHGTALLDSDLVATCPSLSTLIVNDSAVSAPVSSSSSSSSSSGGRVDSAECGALTTLSAQRCSGFEKTVLKLVGLC